MLSQVACKVQHTHAVFLVVVDEGERQRDVERFVLERVRGSLARLERHHQVDPAGRSLRLEHVDEVLAENGHQQPLEFRIHLYTAAATREHRDKVSLEVISTALKICYGLSHSVLTTIFLSGHGMG